MESVKILNWIETSMKTRFPGCGSSRGSGYGHGSSRGYGHGSSRGSGCGSSRGSGFGDGCVFADGSGRGFSDGSGSGSGDGDGVSSLNGEQICYIDGVPTIINRVVGNLAKGFIVKLSDFKKLPCFVVKGDGYFAHGKTAKEAQEALLEKILEDKSEEERIEEFIAHFPKGEKAKGNEYYEWHHILTGSCKFGRDAFVREKGIDLNAEYTPQEFIDIVKNAYGAEIIKELAKKYETARGKQ